MGFLNILGNVAGIGLAPFTGGASLAIPAALNAVGKIAGGAAGGKADQRALEAQLINQQNRTAADLFGTQQGAQMQAGQLDLQRKGFTEDARSGRAKQAILGDLLSNLQDVSINVPGIQTAQISGGLRPSALGATGRQSAGELAKQALLAQIQGGQGEQFTGGQLLQAPQLQGMPKAGGLEKFLDIVGLGSSLAGGVGSAIQDARGRGSPYIPEIGVQTGLDPRLLPGAVPLGGRG